MRFHSDSYSRSPPPPLSPTTVEIEQRDLHAASFQLWRRTRGWKQFSAICFQEEKRAVPCILLCSTGSRNTIRSDATKAKEASIS